MYENISLVEKGRLMGFHETTAFFGFFFGYFFSPVFSLFFSQDVIIWSFFVFDD